MNKSFIAALFLIIAALFFSSCGGTAKSTEEKVEEQTEAVGEAAEDAKQKIEDVAGDAKQKIEDTADAVKDETKATTEETKDAVVAAANKALAGYETLVNKVLPLAEKVKKGDVKAIADYTKQSKEIKDYVSKHATELTGLTGEDAKKYKELGESLINSFKK